MIKTFRGKLEHGEQVTIRLSTSKGEIGYSIKKFQIIDDEPGVVNCELVSKVFTRKQTTVDGDVDFGNSELLAMCYYRDSNNNAYADSTTVIFDAVKVNQDIYVTVYDNSGNNEPTNYYLELEQVKLDLSEATVATLKDMRGTE